MLGQVRQR